MNVYWKHFSNASAWRIPYMPDVALLFWYNVFPEMTFQAWTTPDDIHLPKSWFWV